MTVNTFRGGTFAITTNGCVKVTDAKNRVAKVVATDLQCSNGIISVLEKVLLS